MNETGEGMDPPLIQSFSWLPKSGLQGSQTV
jgi:hypothetical protein